MGSPWRWSGKNPLPAVPVDGAAVPLTPSLGSSIVRSFVGREGLLSIQKFELFHGAVLAKIMRSYDQTLRMVETRPKEHWSVYTVNDEIHVFIKYRGAARELDGGRLAWSFNFSSETLEKIKSLSQDKETYIVLVGGQRCVDEVMEVGVLSMKEFISIAGDGMDTSFSITMRYVPGKELRILRGHKEVCKVARNRADKWQIPGA